jgi:hypothetical protein
VLGTQVSIMSSRSGAGALCALFIFAHAACNRSDKPNHGGALAARESASAAGSTPAMAASPSPAVSESVNQANTGGAAPEGKNTSDNMARNFQGRRRLKIGAHGRNGEIRYLSKDNRARLQLDDIPGTSIRSFDSLIDADKMIVLLNDRREYYARKLSDVEPKKEHGPDVNVDQTGDRIVVAGLTCNQANITQGVQKIAACIRGAPGPFDVGKFESVAGIDVPPWVRAVLDKDYWPITASVRDAKGKELYSVNVVEYSPGPVQDSELAIPPNYREVDASKAGHSAVVK